MESVPCGSYIIKFQANHTQSFIRMHPCQVVYVLLTVVPTPPRRGAEPRWGPTSFKAERCYPLPLQNTPSGFPMQACESGNASSLGETLHQTSPKCALPTADGGSCQCPIPHSRKQTQSPRKFFLLMQSYRHSHSCLTSP